MPISWDAFLARYGPMARAIARSLVRPPVGAEDVVQEAALALFHALEREPERFQGPAHTRNYFLRAVRNLALKTQRGERGEALSSDPPARDPDDPAAREVLERQRLLARLIGELDPASRELFTRRFVERQTLARIAKETRVPLSTLHTRAQALVAGLRSRLEALEREEAG